MAVGPLAAGLSHDILEVTRAHEQTYLLGQFPATASARLSAGCTAPPGVSQQESAAVPGAPAELHQQHRIIRAGDDDPGGRSGS